MQAAHISWGVRACALARSSKSGERKSRSRKTKEERRAMVESFIKRHQSLNNGDFPSLNLTHKEVGGSFYTVREIVREIIQENKVLKPGSLSSKALMFESCREELEDESFSDCPSSDFSISVLGIATDLASNPSDISISEAVDEKHVDHLALNISCGSFVDLASANVEHDEADIINLSTKCQDTSIVHEQIFSEAADSIGEDPEILEIIAQEVPSRQFGSSFSPSSNVVASNVDGINNTSDEAEANFSYRESSDSKQFHCPEIEVFPMHSTSNVCTNNELLAEPKDLESRGAPISSPTELRIDYVPVEIHDKTTEELPFNNENAMNLLPAPVLSAPASGTLRNEEAHSQVKDGDEHKAMAMRNFRSLSSSKETKESKTEENNPFWTAFKAFVAAVIRFWTE